MASIGARHMDETPEQRLQRFSKLGTIDLRIDYLRPGIRASFELRTRRCCAWAHAWGPPAWSFGELTENYCLRRRRLHRFMKSNIHLLFNHGLRLLALCFLTVGAQAQHKPRHPTWPPLI